jgi:hypothetical protein
MPFEEQILNEHNNWHNKPCPFDSDTHYELIRSAIHKNERKNSPLKHCNPNIHL